ncbi:MAG: hypothetical protein QNJ18_21690 [Xenococcaceae cyanobacterium MO_167.B52]|nr:hypothetical protein [Xenococcaceae cyanobacterium MO_167.B52]
MNIKTVIFSGIMTALIGAMLGLGVNHISQRTARRPLSVIGGAVLGFVIGSAYEAIQQNKPEPEEDINE